MLPELRRAKEAREKLKHAILAIKLQKRIAKLKVEESDSDSSDMGDAEAAIPGFSRSTGSGSSGASGDKKPSLKDKMKDGAVFREVVMAKVREEKAKREAALTTDEDLVQEARRRSFNAPRE